MIQQTSLDSFLVLQDSGRLGANQVIVMDVFRLHDPMPLSNADVARILGWGINRVTPRVLELRKAGKLVHVMNKSDLNSGRRVMTWALPETVRRYS